METKTKIFPTPEELETFLQLPLADRLRILDQLRAECERQRKLNDHLAPPDIYFIEN